MRFFATQFSKARLRLLISSVFLGVPVFVYSFNILKTSNLKEETPMPASRSEVAVQDRWNVEALYQTSDSWKADLALAKGQERSPKWPDLAQFKGRLKDASSTVSLIDSYLSLQRRLEKLYAYAHLRLDEDLGNDTFKSGFGQISSLLHEFSLETSWIEPELLSLDQKQWDHLLADASLVPYRFHLEKIARMRPHTLAPEQEQLMALSGQALDAASKAFGALNNADLTFQAAQDSKGQEHPLSNGSYLTYLNSSDRTLRRTAFEHLHRGYESHANTLCELLQGQVQGHLFVARSRNFDSCLKAALFPHQVDPAVYTNLIQAVRRRLPLMHEYVALRKKLLKLSDIHVYDLYVPIVQEAEVKMSYEEARDAVVASVAPLGAEYQKALQRDW